MAEHSAGHVWEAVAEAWETNRDRVFEAFRPASEWLVDAIDPRPGQTILEVAAGPGETGFLAAERVGSEGRIISTDVAPTMVDAARRGAASRGLDNVECRVMDAQQLDLPDDAVDAVISRLGLMLVPDPSAALREIRRVLRDGGPLAYIVIGAPDANQWIGLMTSALTRHDHRPAGGDPFAFGGPFGLARPEQNLELVAAAGFADVELEELAGTMSFEDVDDYWELQTTLAGPLKAMVDGLSPEERAAVRATLVEMLAPFETDGGFDLSTQVIAVRAR